MSKLLWDTAADVRGIEEEFYRTAFGPAAECLERCYRRWETCRGFDERALALAHRDLQEAVKLTAALPEYRARVDHVRMYLHFLKASLFLQDTPLTGDDAFTKQAVARLEKRLGAEAVKQKVRHLGEYVRRLMETNMVHSYAFNSYLAKVGKVVGCDTRDWQKPGAIPGTEEIDRTFQEDLKDYDLAALKDVEPRFFSSSLVAVKPARPDLIKKEEGRKIVCEPLRKGARFSSRTAGGNGCHRARSQRRIQGSTGVYGILPGRGRLREGLGHFRRRARMPRRNRRMGHCVSRRRGRAITTSSGARPRSRPSVIRRCCNTVPTWGSRRDAVLLRAQGNEALCPPAARHGKPGVHAEGRPGPGHSRCRSPRRRRRRKQVRNP